MARSLTGLSRKKFGEKTTINTATLRAWEKGINPIKPITAMHLSQAFQKCGVNCSPDWLLLGEGSGPTLSATMKSQGSEGNRSFRKEITIQTEIATFKNTSDDSKVIIISDDTMEPFYELGDIVGTDDFTTHIALDHLIGCNCIIETVSHDILVRKVISRPESECYNLIGTNQASRDPLLIIPNVKILKCGKVIWHRKKS